MTNTAQKEQNSRSKNCTFIYCIQCSNHCIKAADSNSGDLLCTTQETLSTDQFHMMSLCAQGEPTETQLDWEQRGGHKSAQYSQVCVKVVLEISFRFLILSIITVYENI